MTKEKEFTILSISVRDLQREINLMRKPVREGVADTDWKVGNGGGWGAQWEATIVKETGSHYHSQPFFKFCTSVLDANILFEELMNMGVFVSSMKVESGYMVTASILGDEVAATSYSATNCENFAVAISLIWLSIKRRQHYMIDG